MKMKTLLICIFLNHKITFPKTGLSSVQFNEQKRHKIAKMNSHSEMYYLLKYTF